MSERARASRPRRPRLRTVLLAVNVAVLAMPLLGIALLRIYENELIRTTETQLLSLGMLVREMYRDAWRNAAHIEAAPGSTSFGAARTNPGSAAAATSGSPADAHAPELPALEISRAAVRPPAPDALPPGGPPDPLAAAAGAAIVPALQGSAPSTLVGIRVVDPAGIVVATTRGDMGLSLAAREEVARALRGESVSLLRQRISDEPPPPLASLSRGQRYRVFVALPVVEDGRTIGAVVLSRTPLDIAKALYLRRRTVLIGAGLVLAAMALVTALTALTIGRPVRALIRQAERVTRGERGARVELRRPGTDEVARLSAALAEMAGALEQRAESIRTFASHVSHEFKTPLASLRGATELLRDHLEEMTPEERGRFLGTIDASAQRLDLLVRRLLELARADAVRPGEDRTDGAEAIEWSAARAREAGLRVEIEHGPGVGRVRMGREALEGILGHLLDNAMRYGGAGNIASVSTRSVRAGGSWVEIRVSDQGPGISDANAGRVFTPFFTTSRESGGTGLGLSIARSLAEAHGGSLELECPRPATFLLRVPADGGDL